MQPTISLKLDSDMLDGLKKMSRARSISMSSLAREAFSEKLNYKTKKQTEPEIFKLFGIAKTTEEKEYISDVFQEIENRKKNPNVSKKF
jgi:hypothetical protein